MPRTYGGDRRAALNATDGNGRTIDRASINYSSIGCYVLGFLDNERDDADIDIMSSEQIVPGFKLSQTILRYIHTPLLRRHSGDDR